MRTCVYASGGIEIDTTGRVKPCCIAKPFLDENGEEYNVSKYDLQDIWDSASRKNLIEDLSNGIENPICNICWDEERNGRESKRQRENNCRELNQSDTPQFLDLKLSNTCNLRCRTCNPENSSSWMNEWFDIYYSWWQDRSEFMDKYRTIRGTYVESNSNIWNSLEKWIPSSLVIDIYGGEPLLIKRSWDILKECATSGNSKNQQLHFNTNSTLFLTEEQLATIKNFKSVNISLSIDGIAEKFEYMRYPAKWEDVLAVIEKYYELQNSNDNISVQFCYTVSMLNVWDVPEFDRFVIDKFPNIGTYYNMLFYPEKFSIRNIPENKKQKVKQKLLSYSNRMVDITNMLDGSVDSEEYENFWETIELHDKYRKNYFKESFPEWHSVLVE